MAIHDDFLGNTLPPTRMPNPKRDDGWLAPDEVLVAAGAEGERIVSRARLVIISMLLITPTYKVLVSPESPVFFWGFWITVAAAVSAVVVHLWLKARGYRPLLGFYSSIADVSFVSLALGLFMFLGSPLTALNSKVTFEIYFLAITAASLRYDQRIAIVAGVIAVLQYSALVLFANVNWDLDLPGLGQNYLGTYSHVDQLTRIILLIAAVVISQYLVRRATRLLYLNAHDALTGVSNRRHFEEQAARDLSRSRREEEPLTIAMVDADHFKRLNDSFGHAIGDSVLECIANALHQGIREEDLVARYGGEEFVLCFPGASRDQVAKRLDRLRRVVTDRCRFIEGLPEGTRVTFSAGVAAFPIDGMEVDDLIQAADSRMLKGKREGRDKVVQDD